MTVSIIDGEKTVGHNFKTANFHSTMQLKFSPYLHNWAERTFTENSEDMLN
jgi:hypothetical protein